MPLPLPKLERHYFRTSDGARLAYYVTGVKDGPPLLISAGLGGGIRAWSAIITRLMHRFRVYAWDYRGLYASTTPGMPPESDKLTIPAHARDLSELIDHLDLHRERQPILGGWSMGVQVTFELGRMRPHLARAMIALHGSPGNILSTAFNGKVFHQVAPSIFNAMRSYGEHFKLPARRFARSRRLAMGFMRAAQRFGIMDQEADSFIFHDMARDWVQLDLATYATIFEHLGEHDARDVLPTLDAPTLVVAGSDDPFTPLHLSETIVSLMPDAELFVVPGATHFGPLEYPEEIANEILRFCADRLLVAPAQ